VPGSFAFSPGHSASAFATAVSWHVPALAPLLGPLAGAVAYSRVRTGVHHRADVVAGSAVRADPGGPRCSSRRCWSPAAGEALRVIVPPGFTDIDGDIPEKGTR
jgi:undecaprenyl-diphosphatase